MAVINTTAPTFTPGLLPTAAQLNTLTAIANAIQAPWSDFTPTFTASTTNPVLGGTGQVAAGRYMQVGKTVFGEAILTFGTAGPGAGSGNYMFGLPVPAATQLGSYSAVIGSIWVLQKASTNNYVGALVLTSATQALGRIHGTAGNVSNASPVAWAGGDSMRYQFQYEAA